MKRTLRGRADAPRGNAARATALPLLVALWIALYPATGAAQGAAGSLANPTFTSAVVDGAPVDFREGFFTDTRVAYFYAELLDLAGQTVRFRWSREGSPMQEFAIAVAQERHPAWTRMTMQSDWTGNWAVEVVDGAGRVVGRRNFAYNPI